MEVAAPPPALVLLTIEQDEAHPDSRVLLRIGQTLHRDQAKTAFVYDSRMTHNHKCTWADHPECPERVQLIFQELKLRGFAPHLLRVPARLVTKAEVGMCHELEHWDNLERAVKLDADALRRWCDKHNSLFLNGPGSLEAARLACGGVVELIEMIMEGRARNGLAVVRPPGHHAETHRAMGFCLFNTVAIAAARARALGARRVLIVDWDIHHGNGIQEIFAEDPSVLYFSVHRHDRGTFFPCGDESRGRDATFEASAAAIGEGLGRGTSVNVAWNTRGSATRPGDAEYAAVWSEILMPIATEFEPDIILVAAGFDAAEGDPLGGCYVTPEGYASMTRELMRLANGRLVIALEGGYSLSATRVSAAACMGALVGLHTKECTTNRKVLKNARVSLDSTRERHKEFWKSLC